MGEHTSLAAADSFEFSDRQELCLNGSDPVNYTGCNRYRLSRLAAILSCDHHACEAASDNDCRHTEQKLFGMSLHHDLNQISLDDSNKLCKSFYLRSPSKIVFWDGGNDFMRASEFQCWHNEEFEYHDCLKNVPRRALLQFLGATLALEGIASAGNLGHSIAVACYNSQIDATKLESAYLTARLAAWLHDAAHCVITPEQCSSIFPLFHEIQGHVLSDLVSAGWRDIAEESMWSRVFVTLTEEEHPSANSVPFVGSMHTFCPNNVNQAEWTLFYSTQKATPKVDNDSSRRLADGGRNLLKTDHVRAWVEARDVTDIILKIFNVVRNPVNLLVPLNRTEPESRAWLKKPWFWDSLPKRLETAKSVSVGPDGAVIIGHDAASVLRDEVTCSWLEMPQEKCPSVSHATAIHESVVHSAPDKSVIFFSHAVQVEHEVEGLTVCKDDDYEAAHLAEQLAAFYGFELGESQECQFLAEWERHGLRGESILSLRQELVECSRLWQALETDPCLRNILRTNT